MSIGKACVRFKEPADLEDKALVALIKETAKMGLVARARTTSVRQGAVRQAQTKLMGQRGRRAPDRARCLVKGWSSAGITG